MAASPLPPARADLIDQPYGRNAMRRGTRDFLIGKAISAVMSFAIMLLLVRLLPLQQFGVYVTWLALLELAHAIGGVGLPWVALRYLPEFRLYASSNSLRRFVRRWLAGVLLATVAVVLMSAAGLSAYLAWSDMQEHHFAAAIFLAAIGFELAGRHMREGLLEPLMQQLASRISLILRQSVMLAAVLTLWYAGELRLIWVVAAELVASLVGAVSAWVLMRRHLASLNGTGATGDWTEPAFSAMWRTAIHMFGAQLVSLSYGPAMLTVVAQRTLGLEATALFGFLRQLCEQVWRYLPSIVLMGVVRPKLVAAYCVGGMFELSRISAVVAKMTILTAAPVIVFAAIAGSDLIVLLSGGKFQGSGWLFFGLTLSLLPMGLRQLYEAAAVTTGRSELCMRASLSGLLTLPLLYALVSNDFGLWALVIVFVVGHLLFVGVVAFGLSRAVGFSIDAVGLGRVMVAGAIAWGLLAAWAWPASNWGVILVQGLAVTLLFLLAAYGLRPFNLQERQLLDSLVGRRWFARQA